MLNPILLSVGLIVGCSPPDDPPRQPLDTFVRCGEKPERNLDEGIRQLDRDGDGMLLSEDLATGEAIVFLSMSGDYVDYGSRVATWPTAYSDRAPRLAMDEGPDGTTLLLEMNVACRPAATLEFVFVEQPDGSFVTTDFSLEVPDNEVGVGDDASVVGTLSAVVDASTASGHLESDGMDIGGPLYAFGLPRRSALEEETGVAVHVEALVFNRLRLLP